MLKLSPLRSFGTAALFAVALSGCTSLSGQQVQGPGPTITSSGVGYDTFGPRQPNSGFSSSGSVISDAGGTGVFGTTDQITVDDSGPFPNNDLSLDGSLSDLSADDQALLAGTGIDFAAEAAAASSLSFPGDDGTPAFFDADIGNTIFFGTNSSELSEDARETLRKQAAWLNVHPTVSATIEGHTDERGTREYNLALGERRASAVRGYLTALGVGQERVRKVSYGKERPLISGSSEAAWSRNRRAETKLDGGGERSEVGLSDGFAPQSTPETSVDSILNDPILSDPNFGDPLLDDPLLNDPLLNDV